MSRTVVVSGGGTGIGFAAARTFARDGDQLVLIGRRADVLERAAAELPGAVACPADLTDPQQVARAAHFVCEEFGAVDVLVNNAGGSGRLEPPAETDDPLAATAHDWTVNFRLNVLTAVLLTEALRDHVASPGGRVLFLSSIAALRGSGRHAYGSAKAGLHPYAFALAADLGPRGITVNLVAPGYIEETGFFGDGMPEERRQARIDETLNHRPGHPGDVAETLHWLASPAADHITAQLIQVNGGAERGR
ncbi:SDR family NAD(P)-dependent oxidoreductase [Streptomyces sp. 8N616]|uniref:SDR family NAD(P)-dependent oxidoreductase n=1 Tax=Streptomyces sp. 8N616 TaxID=3457414 RepID=UPI003FD25A61